MKTQHTPPPWHVENDTITSINGDIARVHYQSSRRHGSDTANAQLIAAAPELLDALNNLQTSVSGHLNGFYTLSIDDIMPALDAICKARGIQ